jgi:hypothetical protein
VICVINLLFSLFSYCYFEFHGHPVRWKNCVRHNLTRYFEKTREKDAHGHYWSIEIKKILNNKKVDQRLIDQIKRTNKKRSGSNSKREVYVNNSLFLSSSTESNDSAYDSNPSCYDMNGLYYSMF